MAEAPVVETPSRAVGDDLIDERLIRTQGLGGVVRLVWDRVRGGELGSLPVVLGLVVISLVFSLLEPVFLSSRNLVSIMQFAAPVGVRQSPATPFRGTFP